jgi:hypothetical protein
VLAAATTLALAIAFVSFYKWPRATHAQATSAPKQEILVPIQPPAPPAPAPTPTPAATPTPTSAPAAEPVAPKAHAARKHAAPSEKGTGYLTVSSIPWGAVLVNGKRMADHTPVYKLPIPSGKQRISIFNPDRNAYSPAKQVTVKAGETQVVGFEW